MSDNGNKPNPNCNECDGSGDISGYFVNHKKRTICNDWVYCRGCFPLSKGARFNEPGYDRCTIDEYTHYRKEGYREFYAWS